MKKISPMSYIYKTEIPEADAACTRFSQKNMDGCNSKNSQAWLWTAVTPFVTFFQITLTRCKDAAKNLLGESFAGILNSDRYASYNWVGLGQRQLCWAHLKREFITHIRAQGSSPTNRYRSSGTREKVIRSLVSGERWNFKPVRLQERG